MRKRSSKKMPMVVAIWALAALVTAVMMYRGEEAQVRTWEIAVTQGGVDDTSLWARMAVYEAGAMNFALALVVAAAFTMVVGAFGPVVFVVGALLSVATAWGGMDVSPMMWIPVAAGSVVGAEGYYAYFGKRRA